MGCSIIIYVYQKLVLPDTNNNIILVYMKDF